MGTKNQPGKFDCYSKAEPDEPMFVLLGRDPAAPILINLWADIRARMGEEQAKVEEAHACADACTTWLFDHGKHEVYKRTLDAADDSMNDDEKDRRVDQLEALVRELCSALGTSDEEEKLRRVAAELLEAT